MMNIDILCFYGNNTTLANIALVETIHIPLAKINKYYEINVFSLQKILIKYINLNTVKDLL